MFNIPTSNIFLNKELDVLYLHKLESYAKRIESGEIALARLDPEEERGRIEGGRIHVEASIVAAAKAGTEEENRRSNQTWAEHMKAVKS